MGTTQNQSGLLETMEENQNQVPNVKSNRSRTLESKRSTKDLLQTIIKTTKINVDNDTLETALAYLEIRHLIIHNNTKADAKFQRLPKHDVVSINMNSKKIILNYDVTNKAINAIFRLCKKVDDELISKQLV